MDKPPLHETVPPSLAKAKSSPMMPSPLEHRPFSAALDAHPDIDLQVLNAVHGNGSISHASPVPALAENAIQRRPVPVHPDPDALLADTNCTQDLDTSEKKTPTHSPTTAARSVQFASSVVYDQAPPQTTRTTADDYDGADKSRALSFISKLKALAGSGSLQTPRSTTSTIGPNLTETPSQPLFVSPTAPSTRATNRVPETLDEFDDSDEDADAEETADESSNPTGWRTRTRQRLIGGTQELAGGSVSNTPTPRGDDQVFSFSGRLNLVRRRTDVAESHGLSEGEGQERLRVRGRRRGTSFVSATQRVVGEDGDDVDPPGVSAKRLGHFRRRSAFAGLGGASDGDPGMSRRPFMKKDRATSFGAQKWKQVKSTLKLLRQKKEDRFDYYKSAELMAELRAGAPAVLILASMLQRDEHGNRRIPVLLEQIKFRITDSAPVPESGDNERHWLFTIGLEYGNGPSRMRWTIVRSLTDFYNLHLKYKLSRKTGKNLIQDRGSNNPSQPKFPWSAFPYLRGARNVPYDGDEEEQTGSRPETNRLGSVWEDSNGPDADSLAPAHEPGVTPFTSREGGNAADPEPSTQTTGPGYTSATRDENAVDSDARTPTRRKSRMLLGMRKNSLFADSTDATEGAVEAMLSRRRYAEKQRRILEKYLQEMLRWLMFRADSNRLCRFLELSALGVRLAAEGSYHGKECYLYIQSSKGLDFRRVFTPQQFLDRHSRKWFLVRQSYIVCVESPENMNVYDVYLVDGKFRIVSKREALKTIATHPISSKGKDVDVDAVIKGASRQHHTLTIRTSERKVKLFARHLSVMKQFEDAINNMLRQTPWHSHNRFDSFAPVRSGVFAQWLVDGRDYMWNVSRAINMARDVIYIHDWWLSPELYMRRPACISQKWRLDRLLQRKALEGVKIFVIIYRNVEAAVPIDSEYTKFSLLNLHPNIFVQRSPNQFRKNQFFFAHHDKICVVDHDVAFVGGIDLCFGRWDCPQHPLADDKRTGFEVDKLPKDAEHCQLFPGKDYSNPRVQDFFRLSEPYEEMYDRSRIPRMPWHDISMQVVGQPARDLTRHFVQRWNYLRRGRRPTRPLPFLLPPPDSKHSDLEALGLTGTCEVQILRSAATWSLGIEETEASIQTAYIKMIEDSEHFVYIENQFFISSTEAYGTKIINRIGDALVGRILRAHENHEDWKCVILIPLMPGFQNTVDEQEGTSVRLILHCQFRSICRGEFSIFSRLRSAGIAPEDYIQFFSLRQWGKINNSLATEQLYIHAKIIIVDDRVALIGSANINERSMLGIRDSECAAIVRDADMIWSKMAGKPYRVGRFAYSLRLRLMREHLGLDVDEILEQERQADFPGHFEDQMDAIYDEEPTPRPSRSFRKRSRSVEKTLPVHRNAVTRASGDHSHSPAQGIASQLSPRPQVDAPSGQISGPGLATSTPRLEAGFDSGRDSVIVHGREVLVHSTDPEGRGTLEDPKLKPATFCFLTAAGIHPSWETGDMMPPIPGPRSPVDWMSVNREAQLLPLPIVDDTDIGGPAVHLDASGQPTFKTLNPMTADIRLAHIDKDCMCDPLDPTFCADVWDRVAANNTQLFRRVFRCMPDSEVRTWAEYRECFEYGTRCQETLDAPKQKSSETDRRRDGTTGVVTPSAGAVETCVILPPEPLTGDGLEKQSLGQIQQHHSTNPTLTVSDETSGWNEKSPGEAVPRSPDIDAAVSASVRQRDFSSPDRLSADTPFPTFNDPIATKHGESEAAGSREHLATPSLSIRERGPSRDTSIPPTARRRRRATTKGSRRGFTVDDMPSRLEAEELLGMVQGTLVQFPYDWLLTEELNGNWGYQVDGVAPLSIYN